MSAILKVLISRPNVRLGNTLMLTPLIRELQHRLPDARVDILTACQDSDRIFCGFDNVDSIIQLPRHGARNPLQFLKQLKEISKGYDLTLDPCPRSRSSRLYTQLSRAPIRAGFISDSKPRNASVAGVSFAQAPRHMAQYPVYLFRQAMQLIDTTDYPTMSLSLASAELAWGQQQIQSLFPDTASDSPILGFYPRATGAKQLPFTWWHSLFDILSDAVPDLNFLEIVAPGVQGILPPSDKHARFSSPDVRQLASVISAANTFVACDGGIMHLAGSTQTPVLGLFTYTSPNTYRPFNCPTSYAMPVDVTSLAHVAARLCTQITHSSVANTTDRQLPVRNVFTHAG